MKTSNKRSQSRLALTASAFVVAMVTAIPTFAGPQVTSAYGDQFTWNGAEAAAMGGSGAAVYRGGISNVFNPAFLTVEDGQRLDAGVSLDQEHEDRFQPLFDSFDSWVIDAAIASNRHHYWQSGFGWARRVSSGPRAVSVGVSLTDRYPFGYEFEEELRNPSPFPPGSGEPARDMLLAVRERKVTGALRALSIGAAAEASDNVSLGAAFHYHFGTRNDAQSSFDADNAGANESYRIDEDVELRGLNATLGMRAVLDERVELGVAIETALKATGDWHRQELRLSPAALTDTTQSAFYNYPYALRAGLTFRPRTDPRTVFTVEVEYRPWSKFEDGTPEAPTLVLQDAADVRVGVEHTFYNGMPLRFGFRHVNSYADREAGISAFTAGTAAAVGNGWVNVSLELAKTTSVLAHQFGYPSNYFGDTFVTDPMARVEDTRFRLGVSYVMEF